MPVLSTRRRHAPKPRVSLEPSTVACRISVQLQSKTAARSAKRSVFVFAGCSAIDTPDNTDVPKANSVTGVSRDLIFESIGQ
jgi:hypothetical protein